LSCFQADASIEQSEQIRHTMKMYRIRTMSAPLPGSSQRSVMFAASADRMSRAASSRAVDSMLDDMPQWLQNMVGKELSARNAICWVRSGDPVATAYMDPSASLEGPLGELLQPALYHKALQALLQDTAAASADVLAAHSSSSSGSGSGGLDSELQTIIAKQRQQLGVAMLTLLQFVMQQCPEYLDQQQQQQGPLADVISVVEQLLAEDGFDVLVWQYNPQVGYPGHRQRMQGGGSF
jgi:hypothetical protein